VYLLSDAFSKYMALNSSADMKLVSVALAGAPAARPFTWNEQRGDLVEQTALH
jgi:hypothetical protein